MINARPTIQQQARQVYKELPNAGFAWHQAEYAAGTLEDIRDKAKLSGDDKAFQVATAALKLAATKGVGGRDEPDSRVDFIRLQGHSAALLTLSGPMSAPVGVLLAQTGLNALKRSEGKLNETERVSLAQNFADPILAGDSSGPLNNVSSAASYKAAFQAIGGPPSLLGQLISFFRS